MSETVCVAQYAIRIYAKEIYTHFFWDSLYRVSYILGIYIPGIEPVTEDLSSLLRGQLREQAAPLSFLRGWGEEKIRYDRHAVA